MAFISSVFGCICSNASLEIGNRQFRILRKFAEGGFSQLFLIEEIKNKQKWALKRIDCHSDIEVERVFREIEIHNQFTSKENILRLECYVENDLPNSCRFSLVFPFYKRGSLQDELTLRRAERNYIDEGRILRLFHQICTAVSFLHSLCPPIAHRDLKPANVLLSEDDRAVLMDFGSSCACPIIIEDSKQSRRQIVNELIDESAELCSMAYRAPELFFCDVGAMITHSLDIWSLGCLLYALCFFSSPFDEVHERGDSIALAVQSEKLNFPKDKQIFRKETLQLIEQMLKVNPQNRPDIYTLLNSITEQKMKL
ncbi:unnamed protein product [Dracunculus medinensis]|uniref:non-specific serine/threonine protein kinase n=1 Tax=Dracunculus medinensis TaxID=318479 RepID=A0A0N4UEF3_DRAME|nr:unnamed protein product [Dracunculus medinensis]